MRKLLLILSFLFISNFADSHIGSPGVTFEGKAGNYGVMVLITPPEVIPGTAIINIYVKSSGIESIWAKPIYWYAGSKGTPSADEMTPVANEPGHYKGQVWFMDSGTSSINIEIKGSAGNGQILVPVMAVSTTQKVMPASLGWILFGLCMFLVVLMITIISASVSDGLLKHSEAITKSVVRKRWIGATVSTVLLIVILWGGKTWWDSWASDYKRFLYKPLRANSTLLQSRGRSILEFKIDTTKRASLNFTRKLSAVVPDHGKLMHMFLVRAGSMDVFAHLHPQRKDSATYTTPLPPLPNGRYLIFADITRLSGFSETIPDTLEIDNKIPAASTSLDSISMNRDDTYFVTNPIAKESTTSTITQGIVICGKPGIKTSLPDGSTAVWEQNVNEPFLSGKLYELSFSILDENKKPADLQPYLGMMGHAVVMKDDGSVYIHLHPVGSYSMASQQTIQSRLDKVTGPVNWSKLTKASIFMDSINQVVANLEALTEEERNKQLMGNMIHQLDSAHEGHSTVSFPYAFPTPGNYRIWIQMKRNGKILNSAFDTVVE
ncbi:hypothetical protein BH09BAC3_BH09BAC3_25410 [soil metagenome]